MEIRPGRHELIPERSPGPCERGGKTEKNGERSPTVHSTILSPMPVFSFSLSPPRETGNFVRPTGELREENGVRVFGDSFLRWREGILEGRFAGAPYARGYARGRLAYPQIAAGEQDLDFLLRQMVPSRLRRWSLQQFLALTMRQSEKYFSPAHREEIAGLAHAEFPDPLPGRWSPYQRQFSLHALHDFSQRYVDTVPLSGACTGFAADSSASRDSHVYLARNFDFEAGTRFDREKIVAAVVPNNGHRYLSVTFGGLTGVVSGFNDAGLGVSLQALPGAPTAPAGLPTTLLAADILQFDETVEAAAARIAKARVLVGDIYLLADAAGHMAVVEKTPKAFGLRRATGTLVAANGARTPEVARGIAAAPQTSTSPRREERLRELLETHRGRMDVKTAVAILRDRKGLGDRELGPGNRHAIDAHISCHSVVFDLTARWAYVAASPHTLGKFVAFDLALLADGAPADPRVDKLDSLAPAADPFLTQGGYANYLLARQINVTARRHVTQRQYAAAEEAASRALELAPLFVEALAARAEARLWGRNFSGARSDFERAMELDPGPPGFAAEINQHLALASRHRTPRRPLAFPLSPEDLIEENRPR